MNQPCITDVSLISVERQVQLFQGHLPKMNQPCSSEFPAFTQVQPGEGKLLEMSQPLISYLHTTSQVERAEVGKMLEMSQTYICYLTPHQAECADGKQLDMRKICHLFTTMHVQRRGTYELAHFGKGVVIDINRNPHLLVPHTRAHMHWEGSTARQRKHAAARPSQSAVLRKGNVWEQRSRDHVITHTQDRT